MRSLSGIKECTTAAAMGRTRRACTSSAAPQQEQHSTPVHAILLSDLLGTLLAQIWKQLKEIDRKGLCCTAPLLRECIGGLLALPEAHTLWQKACRVQHAQKWLMSLAMHSV